MSSWGSVEYNARIIHCLHQSAGKDHIQTTIDQKVAEKTPVEGDKEHARQSLQRK